MMTPEEQQRLIYDHLAQREAISTSTAEALEARKKEWVGDPLEAVDPEIRRQVEDAFYAERGKFRYVGSNGRVHWLTQEQIAQRTNRRRAPRTRAPLYGPVAMNRRLLYTWGFNLGAIVLAILVVWLLLL